MSEERFWNTDEYAVEQNCTEETAAEYLTLAIQNRSRVPFYATTQDEDGEETGEDVTRDDSCNYADILWNGIRADVVQAAFDKLSRKEKFFLEKEERHLHELRTGNAVGRALFV